MQELEDVASSDSCGVRVDDSGRVVRADGTPVDDATALSVLERIRGVMDLSPQAERVYVELKAKDGAAQAVRRQIRAPVQYAAYLERKQRRQFETIDDYAGVLARRRDLAIAAKQVTPRFENRQPRPRRRTGHSTRARSPGADSDSGSEPPPLTLLQLRRLAVSEALRLRLAESDHRECPSCHLPAEDDEFRPGRRVCRSCEVRARLARRARCKAAA